jgi:hypothetical protein
VTEVETAQARTPCGQRIAAVWSDVLDHEHIDPDADFFYDLGGHSLAAALVVARVAALMDAPIEVLDLYEAPTLSSFVSRTLTMRDELRSVRAAIGPAPTPAVLLTAWSTVFSEINPTAAVTFMAPDATLLVHRRGEVMTFDGLDQILAFLRGLRERRPVLRLLDAEPATPVDIASSNGDETVVGVLAEAAGTQIRRVTMWYLPVESGPTR